MSYRSADCPFERARRHRRGAPATDAPRVDCGRLTVPERRDRDSGRTIELAVAVVHATTTSPAPDPVLYLEGGPGGSALAGIELWTAPASPLLATRDVILLDQRGTGYSSPRLSCDAEADASPDEVSTACWKRLIAEGVDPDAYNTGESAADVADLRRALGLREWNLFGVSYGTRLALRVMRDHPDGIRSVVLDSVYPADVHGIDDEPRNAAASIIGLLERCRADTACREAYPELQARFFAAVDRLDANPVEIADTDPDSGDPVTVTVTGADLVNAAFDTLYDTSALPSLPHALDLAARGRVAEALDVIADPPSARSSPSGSPTEPPPSDERPDDSDGLYLSVECSEEAPKNRPSEIEARSATIEAPLRRALVADALDLLASCTTWPVQPKPLPTTESEVPTLVLAGGLDPITPAAWGEQAARGLRRSTFHLFPDAGHVAFDSGDCARSTVVSFLQHPAEPPETCPPDPIRFAIGS